MLWSRVLPTAVLASISTSACATTTICPIFHDHHKLTAVDVYDGPPSELASLTPDDEGAWKLGYKPASTQGRFYLGCAYGKDGTPLPIELPANVAVCKIGNYPQVGCR